MLMDNDTMRPWTSALLSGDQNDESVQDAVRARDRRRVLTQGDPNI